MSASGLPPLWFDKNPDRTHADNVRDLLTSVYRAADAYTGAGAVIGTIVVAMVAEKLNRRVTYIALCIASLVVCQILFRSSSTYGVGFLAMVGLTNALTAGFFGWLPLYLPELFPTRVRATAQGLAFNSGRIVAAAGTLLGGQLVASFGGDVACVR